MSEITLNINFLKFGFIFSCIYIGFRIIGLVFRIEVREGWLALFKTISYGLLALFIYKYCLAKQLTEVPIVDAFTFILCCLEFSGNLVLLVESITKPFIVASKMFKSDDV
ncbi:hypothetical protein ASG89_26650 [Paenibacillus sp. Soil766]|uniref:hypothetical protein n=1 Tax=Paenibacillus sp. Soil766 TaxID=1736404 RepID=UPI00071071E0|nr:hypothetical protein [Paenibacillus sp. Soil766]KRF00416.1 hypothetical protein ASG89_26650 [Paenibacillus sp. Soil766]